MKIVSQRISILCIILFAVLYSQNQNKLEITSPPQSDSLNINQQVLDLTEKVNSLETKIELQQLNKEYFGHTLMIFTGIVTILIAIAATVGGYFVPLVTRRHYKKQLDILEKKYKTLFFKSTFESYRVNQAVGYIELNAKNYLSAFKWALSGLDILFNEENIEYYTMDKLEDKYKGNIKAVTGACTRRLKNIKKTDFTKGSTEDIDEINRTISNLLDKFKNEDRIKEFKIISEKINKIYYT